MKEQISDEAIIKAQAKPRTRLAYLRNGGSKVNRKNLTKEGAGAGCTRSWWRREESSREQRRLRRKCVKEKVKSREKKKWKKRSLPNKRRTNKSSLEEATKEWKKKKKLGGQETEEEVGATNVDNMDNRKSKMNGLCN
ncbi:hypothetical protein DY000_02027079 [Brassica cretica]|uniref:Uncharacterized protein n=1 Tax=Brassica cretica TaxID=69181 RepID=A0ABQ7E627_BRACR|nr:hypothetical protein DY000_02027079 [Brassica cretica]